MSNQNRPSHANRARCRAAVIWIDWYAYHHARFRGLLDAFGSNGEVVGIELVGGIGVHAGLSFREDLPPDLPVETLMPQASWHEASKIRLAIQLWQRLSTLNPDLVLVPGYYTLPGITSALWAKIHRRSSILMTESTASDHTRSVWKESLKSAIIRNQFDWAVTGGSAHVRYLIQLGFPLERIARFYDVVDNDGIRQKTEELRLHAKPTTYGLPNDYFLFVGRMAPEKNVDELLRSWILYREKGGSWPLILVGDGPDMQKLRIKAAKSAYAEDIYFPGHKNSRQLLPFFSFANCFILPSTREPWGLVVNEAMAASLPVIVSNRCGCAEDLVSQKHNGFVFDPDHEGELTNFLTEIETLSARDLQQMGAASARKIASYSPKNFGIEIASIANDKHQSLDRELFASTPNRVSTNIIGTPDGASSLSQVAGISLHE